MSATYLFSVYISYYSRLGYQINEDSYFNYFRINDEIKVHSEILARHECRITKELREYTKFPETEDVDIEQISKLKLRPLSFNPLYKKFYDYWVSVTQNENVEECPCICYTEESEEKYVDFDYMFSISINGCNNNKCAEKSLYNP